MNYLKNKKYNLIKFAQRSILLTSFIPVTIGANSASAMFKSFMKSVSCISTSNPTKVKQLTGTLKSPLNSNQNIQSSYSSINTRNSNISNPFSPVNSGGNESKITSFNNNVTNNNSRNITSFSVVKTATSEQIFSIYTSSNNRLTPTLTTPSNSINSTNSNSQNSNSSPSTISKNNTSSLKLNLTSNSNTSLQSLTYSKKALRRVEDQIRVFTASVVKTNLPEGTRGKIDLKFNQELNKELNSTLARFVYASTMDTLKSHTNNSN